MKRKVLEIRVNSLKDSLEDFKKVFSGNKNNPVGYISLSSIDEVYKLLKLLENLKENKSTTEDLRLLEKFGIIKINSKSIEVLWWNSY